MAAPVSFGNQQLIVGREREQDHLGERLAHALDGQGGLVLVSGEAGIGKTTLVENLVTTARDHGALILSGHCYDLSTTPPYGPWIEAIRDYRPDAGQAPVPAWIENPTERARAGSQAALFEELGQFFEDLAGTQPLLIVLEDLHWSDQVSMELLRHLARRLTGVAILVIATYRDDEIIRREDLHEFLPVLIRESRAHRIHLNPLDEAAVRELTRRNYDLTDPDAERLVEHLLQRSEGNPFFAREILYGLESDRLLRAVDGGWELSDLAGARVPALLHQPIQDRITRLTPDTRAGLQVAAVIGQEVSLGLWREIAGLQEAEFDRVIAESLEAQMLEERRDALRLADPEPPPFAARSDRSGAGAGAESRP